MITASLVSIVTEIGDVKELATESVGIIVSASAPGYVAGDPDATVEVTVRNEGELPTDYLVTLTKEPDFIDGPPAQFVSLGPTESADISFDLQQPDGVFDVFLKSPEGKPYDSFDGLPPFSFD